MTQLTLNEKLVTTVEALRGVTEILCLTRKHLTDESKASAEGDQCDTAVRDLLEASYLDLRKTLGKLIKPFWDEMPEEIQLLCLALEDDEE